MKIQITSTSATGKTTCTQEGRLIWDAKWIIEVAGRRWKKVSMAQYNALARGETVEVSHYVWHVIKCIDEKMLNREAVREEIRSIYENDRRHARDYPQMYFD